MKSIRVWRKDARTPVMVDVVRHSNSLAVHTSLDNPGWSVTHIPTGMRIFGHEQEDVAARFFEEARTWPEWDVIKSKMNAQFLKSRVLELRSKCREVDEP
jgi:hypothetical protein